VRPRDFKPCLFTYKAFLPLNTIAVDTPRGHLQYSSDHIRCYCCDVSLFSLPAVQLLSVIAIAVVAIGGFGQRFSSIHLLEKCMCFSWTRQAFSGLRDLLCPKGDKKDYNPVFWRRTTFCGRHLFTPVTHFYRRKRRKNKLCG